MKSTSTENNKREKYNVCKFVFMNIDKNVEKNQ